MSGDKLGEYRHKRDFAATPEPSGEDGSPAADQPRFVVQIHDASSMHFDFRLEVDGVLKSWAVPKGPSDNPHDKRLAVPTEDHPLAYRDFEGVVGEGQYGAGTVIVWDEGTYQNLTADRHGEAVAPAVAVGRGHISFRLKGSKLCGGYALTRIRDHSSYDEAWLLVKEVGSRSTAHGTPNPRRAHSARSGRTLKQVTTSHEAKSETR